MGKQSKKKASKQVVEGMPRVEAVKPISADPAAESAAEPWQKRWRSFILPTIGLVVLAILVIGKDTESILHPWTRADMLCDSAGKVTVNAQKQALLSEAGILLHNSVSKHPYHARIWAIYGHYHAKMENWDSCLYAEKKAIEMGKGSNINSIEPMAKYFMNVALKNKMEPIYKQKETALKVLQDLEIPGYYNEVVDKFRGFVYVNNSDFDSANNILIKYLATKPNDFDVLYAMAANYTNQGMKSEALSYAYRARTLQPNNQSIQNIIRLNSQ